MAKDEAKKEAVAEKEGATQSSSASGSGSKLPALLGVVNLLLTLGIGAVLFIQFQKEKHIEKVSDIQPNAPVAEAKESGHGEAGGEGHAGADSKKQADTHKVVSLEQFTVNLSTAVGAPPKFARVMIAVELASSEAAAELTQKTPQVRNAIIDLFNSKRPADLQTGEGRNFLKEEIRNALNSFLVTGKVKGIFFSNFSVSS